MYVWLLVGHACQFGDVEEARAFLLNEGLVHFQSQSGVILFVYSMLLTKGPAAIRRWMDAPDNTLTGQFGHCTQEVGPPSPHPWL